MPRETLVVRHDGRIHLRNPAGRLENLMITCPVTLALMLFTPQSADTASVDTKTDPFVLQASVAAIRSEKAAAAFGLKVPSVRMPLAVDPSGRTVEPIQPAVYFEENSSGDLLPSPQRVVEVPELKAIEPK